ncbi:MAG: hypothetical protein KIT46_11285 [Anaerolineales bacterium]|nr:hypothetical protein [Anaerolineales bacterium]MCW5856614.1 hypothetical protein [Anaerolineales bacterium]
MTTSIIYLQPPGSEKADPAGARAGKVGYSIMWDIEAILTPAPPELPDEYGLLKTRLVFF